MTWDVPLTVIKYLKGAGAMSVSFAMSRKTSAVAAAIVFAASLLMAAEASAAGVRSWSGFYVGASAGGGDFDAEVGPGSLSPPGTSGTGFDGDGGLFGVLAGVNFQQGNFVFGLEGDASFGSLSGENVFLTVPDLDIDRIATVRARAGFAFDRIFLFGTAGFAVAEADATETRSTTEGSSGIHTGAIAGAGAEYAVYDNVFVRGEYMRGFFEGDRYSFPDDALHSHEIEFEADIFRAAVTWRVN
jgi:outer membrane immunogenic protein